MARATTIRINIYDASRLLGWVEDEPKAAWMSAVKCVRGYAHSDGVTGPNDGWYRTANSVGYARGIFRATPMLARDS